VSILTCIYGTDSNVVLVMIAESVCGISDPNSRYVHKDYIKKVMLCCILYLVISFLNTGVYCASFDDDKIVSGSADETIIVVDRRTNTRLQIIFPKSPVHSLQFDDTKLVYGTHGN
jgi:WD40 repeat protein